MADESNDSGEPEDGALSGLLGIDWPSVRNPPTVPPETVEAGTSPEALALDNPYWAEVRGLLKLDHFRRSITVGSLLGPMPESLEVAASRETLVNTYSWTVTDPYTVDFVRQHCGPKVIDPMAGSGYWSYLLEQFGVDVMSYDLEPGENLWHSGKLWTGIWKMGGVESVKRHPDRTLLLAWPPMSRAGYKILSAYQGDRVVYIGEDGGCCGDGKLFDTFDKGWTRVEGHGPVQWAGIRDYVTVYDRASYREGGE